MQMTKAEKWLWYTVFAAVAGASIFFAPMLITRATKGPVAQPPDRVTRSQP